VRTAIEVSDEEHVARALAGDVKAFEHLYRRHAGGVYAVCMRISVDPVRADELTQETFVRAWENLSGFRGESAFEHWIRKIAVNTSLVALRSLRRRGSWEVLSEDIEAYASTQDGRHSNIDLEKAIGSLPPQARAVLVMHDVEGYRHEEIARLMNIATGTSKAQLHRARKLLREALL
jgi:RNA polymerase sigma-70 factor (ECF subfamily)